MSRGVRPSRTMAFLGRKGCGCATFARLDVRLRGVASVASIQQGQGLTLQRVPLDQAITVICKCED